jgi:hypothetical protein
LEKYSGSVEGNGASLEEYSGSMDGNSGSGGGDRRKRGEKRRELAAERLQRG